MGSGMAQGAAEVMALLPVFKEQQMAAMEQGMDFPDFQSWLSSPEGQNALKIMPRR
jgi:hypothetical protein